MSFDWSDLQGKCVWYLARERARSRASAGEDWNKATADEEEAAKVDLLRMDNLELLQLIGRVVENG